MTILVENLRRLMAARGIGAIPLARKAGLARTGVSDILTGKSLNPQYATLRKLADALEVPMAALTGGEENLSTVEQIPLTVNADLPVYASSPEGSADMVITMESIEYIDRPSILENVSDAFAFYLSGDAMEPRYEQGERLLVNTRRPPRVGSDVLIILQSDDENRRPAMVRKLLAVSRDKVRLRQWNPARDFDFDRELIVAMYKIMGTQASD